MAKQEEVSLVDIFSNYVDEKKIDRNTLGSVLGDSFRSVISKTVGSDENYNVIINIEKGSFEIYRNRNVVEDDKVEDPTKQISLSEAQNLAVAEALKNKENANVKKDKKPVALTDEERKAAMENVELGEDYDEKVDFSTFGRRAVLNLRQTLASKILELQKDNLYNKYKDKVGTIVTAEVYQAWKREILVVDEYNTEMSLPKDDQIPSDRYKKGDMLTAVVAKVDNTNNDSKIILSRTSPLFLRRLFEREVPEIGEGLITIKNIARIPGERAKVAVESYDDRIDPVGACVGMKGARIHGIVRELRNENIDVIEYCDDVRNYIARALSPAKIDEIEIYDEENKIVNVYLNPEEVSLAIGRGGMNIKLACMLTGYQIEVYRNDLRKDNEGDIYLIDFKDEIDSWVIDSFHKIGCYTAKDVLRIPREELVNNEKLDLEEETIDDVINILKAEFDDQDEDQADNQSADNM